MFKTLIISNSLINQKQKFITRPLSAFHHEVLIYRFCAHQTDTQTDNYAHSKTLNL